MSKSAQEWERLARNATQFEQSNREHRLAKQQIRIKGAIKRFEYQLDLVLSTRVKKRLHLTYEHTICTNGSVSVVGCIHYAGEWRIQQIQVYEFHDWRCMLDKSGAVSVIFPSEAFEQYLLAFLAEQKLRQKREQL